MALFQRTSYGLKIVKGSFKVINANRQLLIFPVLSGVALAAVFGLALYGVANIGSFFGNKNENSIYPLLLFCSYLVSYFIIAFFNMALIHCVSLFLDGEQPTIAQGLRFSASRIHSIFLWALFAATIGTLLRLVRDQFGRMGRIAAAGLGIVWGITTFFVVPIIAYEKLGPLDALKRSSKIMKEKWGESLVASYSFALLPLLFMIVVGFIGLAVAAYVSDTAGAIIFGGGVLLAALASSTLNTIFIAAVYKQTTGGMSAAPFDQKLLNGLFAESE